MLECSLCVDQKHLPWTILVLLLLQCIDLHAWWACRRGEMGQSMCARSSVHYWWLGVSKWLRNKVEMKEGAAVQEKWTEESDCFLLALLWVPAAEVMDKHLSRQVVLPEWHGLAEKSKKGAACHDALVGADWAILDLWPSHILTK